MWQLKGLLSNNKRGITKLLNEDWEPFAAVQEKNGVIKIYFKKKDFEKELVEQIGDELRDFFAPRMDSIEELMRQNLSNISSGYTRSGETNISEIVFSGDLTTSASSLNQDEQLPSEEELVKEIEQEENPHGYKVVDEIPELANSHSEEQEKAIDTIRRTAPTNITVNPVAKDGSVTVLVGSKRHIINRAGETKTEETGAHTNSLAV